MVVAVDADFAAAVDLVHAGVRLQQDGVAVRAAGRVAVRQGPRQVFGQVQVEGAAAGDVELLHAEADAQDGHLPLDDPADQEAVALVAALGHGLDGGVRWLLPSRVHVEAAAQDDAVQPVEQGIDLGSLARGGRMTGRPPAARTASK